MTHEATHGATRPDEPEVRIVDDSEAASSEAARVIAARLVDAIERRGRADWATTGGSTPIGIYRDLAVAPLRDRVAWDRVHIWWGDDRFVPRDDPLSNVQACDQILLAASAFASLSGEGESGLEVELGLEPGVPIPPSHVHAMPIAEAIAGARTPAWVADAYARELREAEVPTGEGGYPAFDILLLGLGTDGHIMSVFPGSSAFDADAWVLPIPAPTHIAPHVQRVTLNPRVVAASPFPFVVTHGGRKAPTVREVLEGDRDPRALPAQLTRRSGALWIVDRAAAAELSPNPVSR